MLHFDPLRMSTWSHDFPLTRGCHGHQSALACCTEQQNKPKVVFGVRWARCTWAAGCT